MAYQPSWVFYTTATSLEEQWWCDVKNRNGDDKEVRTYTNGIRPKKKAWLEFELASYDIGLPSINNNATGTPQWNYVYQLILCYFMLYYFIEFIIFCKKNYKVFIESFYGPKKKKNYWFKDFSFSEALTKNNT